MVHLRLNEKEANPNPHINFITPLKADEEEEKEARNLLRALAAQVRPVMKAHGFGVNSFEEYEYNKVFAGRNWNNGETVELVLRRPDGSFYPNYWLMSTLCHELAHIKHMNHGPDFQKLWSRFRTKVRNLQDKGYYGDGYWSSGQRLRDSARVGDNGLEAGDFPEYMCGGAQSRARPTARRRRKDGGKRREVVPSLHTGAQTAKKRKSGARVTSKYAFTGEGVSLGADGKGTGFGKQAASKRAREERALAAERRLLALQGGSSATPHPPEEQPTTDEESDDGVECIPETDAERRQAIQEAEHGEDTNKKLGTDFSWTQFQNDFNFEGESHPSGSKPTVPDIIDISSDEDDSGECDMPVASGSTFTSGSRSQGTDFSKLKGKGMAGTGLGTLVEREIELRKKESLGMAPVKGGSRKLGSTSKTEKIPPPRPPFSAGVKPPCQVEEGDTHGSWSCLACTLENKAGHLSCSACATPRNEVWKEDV